MATRRKKKKERLVAEDMLGWLADDVDEPVAVKFKEPRVYPENAAATSVKTLSPKWSHAPSKKWKLDIKKGGASDLITTVHPDDKNYSGNMCRAEKGKGLRACHVELRFVGAKAEAKSGLPKGAYLRFCSSVGKRGKIVPVKSGKEAAALAKQFCECRKKNDVAFCAAEARRTTGPTKAPTLGGLRRPKK